MTRVHYFRFALLSIATLATACSGGGAPQLTSVQPQIGEVGDTVTITGKRFGDDADAGLVEFGAAPATATAWESQTIVVAIPALPLGTIDLVVTVDDEASNAITYTVTDTTAPQTEINAAPTSPTNSDTAAIAFSSPNSDVSRFECAVNAGDFAPCSSPLEVVSLADGAHTVAVRAVDQAANVDASPAAVTWTVDTVAPDTAIDSGPTDPSTAAAATFTFSSPSTDVSGFQCSLDGSAFTACTSPHTVTGLTGGARQFRVAAVDAAGNVDPSPASYAWTVALDAAAVTVNRVTPPFAYRGERTLLSIGGSNFPAGATVQIYNETSSATLLYPITVTTDEISAVLPADSIDIGRYDIRVRSPLGVEATAEDALLVTGAPLPEIASISPDVIAKLTAADVSLYGSALSGVTVTVTQQDADGNVIFEQPASTTVLSETAAEITTPSLSVGVYVLRAYATVLSQAVYGEYGPLVVKEANNKTGAFASASKPLIEARFNHAAIAITDPQGNRYLLVAGGHVSSDTSQPSASVDVSALDKFGQPTGFRRDRTALTQARAWFGLAQNGDWIYALGGSTATTAATSSIERAAVLDLADAPQLDALDDAAGTLDPGVWSYRVAVVYDGSHMKNPNGESIASSVLARYQNATGGIALTWQADASGAAELYRIYRNDGTAEAIDNEHLLATITPVTAGCDAGGTCAYTDDGSATPSTDVSPRRPGSLGTWQSYATTLQVARAQAGWAIAVTAAQTYLYAVGGVTTAAETADSGYESVRFMASGELQQAAVAAPGELLNTARRQTSLAVATTANTDIPGLPAPTLMVFGGYDGTDSALRTIERVRIGPGGTIDAAGWDDSSCGGGATCQPLSDRAAGGVLIVADWAFTFGGETETGALTGASASSKASFSDDTEIAFDSASFTQNESLNPRSRHATLRTLGQIFLIGGIDENDVPLDDLEFTSF